MRAATIKAYDITASLPGTTSRPLDRSFTVLKTALRAAAVLAIVAAIAVPIAASPAPGPEAEAASPRPAAVVAVVSSHI
ncbi:hypothetical protein RCO28_28950 [Streptomyces sp. LHD-70]|uniref:hypothetical protein n=1 Tax=Streptomyces sp. LHD-70 TaxID=3072140 RepID=UPI00280CC756|nr:hypothetical protein [Streptomyces sp. LHD-70]MDQ8706470.1 hypothetical protein [Streptomyces sp. LHD-70]